MDIILKLVKSVGADTLDQKFGFKDNVQYLQSGFKKQRPCSVLCLHLHWKEKYLTLKCKVHSMCVLFRVMHATQRLTATVNMCLRFIHLTTCGYGIHLEGIVP